jgi:hypothetical protein
MTAQPPGAVEPVATLAIEVARSPFSPTKRKAFPRFCLRAPAISAARMVATGRALTPAVDHAREAGAMALFQRLNGLSDDVSLAESARAGNAPSRFTKTGTT